MKSNESLFELYLAGTESDPEDIAKIKELIDANNLRTPPQEKMEGNDEQKEEQEKDDGDDEDD